MAKLVKPELFKGPNRSYFKMVDGNGEVTRVMVDPSLVEKWEDIDEVEVGLAKYQQRAATQVDVEAHKAEKIGDLIEESWSRHEIVNYSTFGAQINRAEFKGKLGAIEKKFSIMDAKSLDSAVA